VIENIHVGVLARMELVQIDDKRGRQGQRSPRLPADRGPQLERAALTAEEVTVTEGGAAQVADDYTANRREAVRGGLLAKALRKANHQAAEDSAALIIDETGLVELIWPSAVHARVG